MENLTEQQLQILVELSKGYLEIIRNKIEELNHQVNTLRSAYENGNSVVNLINQQKEIQNGQ